MQNNNFFYVVAVKILNPKPKLTLDLLHNCTVGEIHGEKNSKLRVVEVIEQYYRSIHHIT